MAVLVKRLSFLLLMLLSASPAFAQRSRLMTSLPNRQILDRYGLQRAWWSQATIDPRQDRVRYITVDEELVYIQTRQGFVTAFENETGRILWSALLGRPNAPSHPLSSNEKIVTVATGLDLFAVDKYSGKVLWSIRTPSTPSTSPVLDKDRAYLGFLDGSVYAFNLAKVRELYAEGRLPEWSFQSVAWRYSTGKEVSTPPLTNGFVVNFASRDGMLYTVTAAERKLLFQFETDAPVSAPLTEATLEIKKAVADSTDAEADSTETGSETESTKETVTRHLLYMASEDYNFYCLDRVSGQVLWEFVSGLPVRTKPRVVGKQVFLLPLRGGLHCLSAENGQQHWWRPNAAGFLAASPQVVYTSDRFGNVVMLSRKDGSVLGTLPMRKFSIRLANDRTDRLYLATEDGLVICLHEKEREFPIYHMHPERRPIMPEFAPAEGSESEQADSGNPASSPAP